MSHSSLQPLPLRPAAEIISIQIGLPGQIGTEKPWTTGFLKGPVTEPLWLGTNNLEGDGQADLTHHGGPHKAVCVYSAEHYPWWRTALQLPDLPWGSFGENFTVGRLTETDVCIGDMWQIGTATVQVSQPRQPCWKLARRWNIKDLALQVQNTGYTGWYFRVLVEGAVQCGMQMTLAERPCPEWTIAAANHIMHHDKHDLAATSQPNTPYFDSGFREDSSYRQQPPKRSSIQYESLVSLRQNGCSKSSVILR